MVNHMASEALISMSKIGKCYDPVIGDWALRDLSFSVFRNEYVSICGPSGCGKSTLLSIMGLVDEPSAGMYLLQGKQTKHLSFDQLAMLRRRHLGFIFQSFNLIDHLSNLENVAMPLLLDGRSRDEALESALALCQELGLQGHVNKHPNQISGGQQQRLSIARALINQPDLLLIDEPTGNLDTKNSELVMDLLDQVHDQGSTLVLVTHEEHYSQRAQRQLHILDGQLQS